MSGLFLSRGIFPHDYFRPTVAFILATQQPDGAIPWFTGGSLDPWDHVEAAMGLSIGGELRAAERAYRWLKQAQLDDGSWWAAYRDGKIVDGERRESNFVAYVATGIWHHYRITRDDAFLLEMWTTVERAIDFVVGLQTEHGEIHWAVDADGRARADALVTGCSSIYKSLECAINIAVVLGHGKPQWRRARSALGDTLRGRPDRFDRTWESKQRFSMDWFYPVLTGVVRHKHALARIASRWDEFVEHGMGCRCVSDEPWITVAESCELTMALLAAGDHARAVTLFSWLHQWRLDDGCYWTGYQFIEDRMWPEEKPTWTAGAILLAADALTRHTAACDLFTKVDLFDESGSIESADPRQLLKES